jgi:hypothetical protein
MNVNKPKQLKKQKIKRKPRVKGKRLPNNRKRRANVIRGKKLAAASAKGFTKRFTMLRQNGNSVRVTGRDLIYSIPDDLTSPIQDTNVITVIPANPAYWKGTRIAALASGYQNYRPILFRITYIPMCAVTQQGNVIGGTIWDDGIDNNNLQQSLRTSNGGFMTQCYVPHTTRIRPKSNLQFNLYRMGGEFSTTSNPFIFIAIAVGCKNTSNQRVTPGYFYVTWSFELKNPIGSINTFNNTGLITYSNLVHEMNTTIININPNSEIPFGAYINIEEEDDQLIAYYNDTPIEIGETTPIWGFTSVSKASSTKMTNKIPIVYNAITTTTIKIGYDGYKGYIKVEEDHYDIYIGRSLQDKMNVRLDNEDAVLLVDNISQNFGTFVGETTMQVDIYNDNTLVQEKAQADFSHFVALKTQYVTEIINLKLKSKLKDPKIIFKNRLSNTQKQPIGNTDTKSTNDTSISQQ